MADAHTLSAAAFARSFEDGAGRPALLRGLMLEWVALPVAGRASERSWTLANLARRLQAHRMQCGADD